MSDNQIVTSLRIKTDEKYRRKAVKIGCESYDINYVITKLLQGESIVIAT